MSVIGVTTVNGTTTLNPQYCPEFIMIGDPLDDTANLLPSAFKVTVSGKPTIDLKTTVLIKAFGEVFGNLSENAGGVVKLGKIYRISYGQLNGKNTEISITQPAGGAAQNIYAFSTQSAPKTNPVAVKATQLQINANTTQDFENFDFLAIDGAIDQLQSKFRVSGWDEVLLSEEQKGLNLMRRNLSPDGTIAGLDNVFPNFDRLVNLVRIYNGAAARNALIVGQIPV
jgi:hypothetical protein